MLGKLEEPCIIVMDNAKHHSTLTEEYPKASTRKADVQKWLQNKFVNFSPVETLSKLREKVKLTMPKEKSINWTKLHCKWAIKWYNFLFTTVNITQLN